MPRLKKVWDETIQRKGQKITLESSQSLPGVSVEAEVIQELPGMGEFLEGWALADVPKSQVGGRTPQLLLQQLEAREKLDATDWRGKKQGSS